MSALNAIARVAAVGTTTAAKTLLQLVAPANQRLRIKEIGIGFHSISNTDPPVTVDLVQQSDAGTSSALTLAKENAGASETLQASALQTFTAEPVTSTAIRTWPIHPQTALVIQFAPGEEIVLPGAGRLGLRVTTSTGQAADAYIRYEE